MFQASVLYWPQGWLTSVRGLKREAASTVAALSGPVMPLAASDFFCQSKSSCSSASRLMLDVQRAAQEVALQARRGSKTQAINA